MTPPAPERLFAHHEPAALDLEAAPALVIPRLLESGDGEELRWLFAAAGRERVAAWLARHGGRQLTRRSRALWALALGVAPAAAHPLAEALWPL